MDTNKLRYNLAKFETLIHGYLGLSFSPPDIDEHAAAILSSAARAVKHILDQRTYLDKIGLQHKPVIALVGETHMNMVHQVHQMLMMAELIKNEDVLMAFEQDHNYLVSDLDEQEYLSYKKQMQLFDREAGGALTLKDVIVSNTNPHAPLSRFTFNRLLLKNRIKVCFCDVAKTLDKKIDQKDSSSCESVRIFAQKKMPNSVGLRDAMGMAARNHHMAKLMMDFAAVYKPRIVFLVCGASHLKDRKERSFEDDNGNVITAADCSLSSFFKRASISSVGILQAFQAKIPEDNTMLHCNDLPYVFTGYNPHTGKPHKDNLFYDIRSAKGEASYLNALLSRTGLASEMASPDDWKAARDQYKKDLDEYRQRAWATNTL